MPVTRANIVDGPGSFSLGALALFSAANIVADFVPETFSVPVSTDGEADTRFAGAKCDISFTPSGRLTAGILAALFPAAFRTPVVGTSVFGAADTAGFCHSTAGKKITFTSCAITKPPELILSPAATLFGQIGIEALIKTGGVPTDADAYYVASDAAWSETFDPDEPITVPYTAAWGAITLNTEDGFRVTCEPQLAPRRVTGQGIIDYKLQDVIWRASCRPVDLTAATLLGYMAPAARDIGSSMRAGSNLVIAGGAGGIDCTLYDASVVKGPCNWGATELRAGEIGFLAHRNDTGVDLGAKALLAIAT